MDGVSGSNQRMVLRSSSAPSTAQGQKLREHSMDEGHPSSGFHNQTLSTHAHQVFSPQQLPAASAPPAQRECHSSEHDPSIQPSAPPVPDTPVEASRVSISNEDNVLLDPEVLVEFSQQALALTILATLVRCTTDENEVCTVGRSWFPINAERVPRIDGSSFHSPGVGLTRSSVHRHAFCMNISLRPLSYFPKCSL